MTQTQSSGRVAPGTHRIRVSSFSFTDAVAMCRGFERRYEVASPDFYREYLAGGVEGHDAARWASYWRLALELAPAPAESHDIAEPSLGIARLSA